MHISIRNYEYDSILLIIVIVVLCWVLEQYQVFLRDKRKGCMHILLYIMYIQGPSSNVFFSSNAYFVNGNTQLMSDLTDNQFYPSAERIWLCIRLNNTGKYCDITLKIMVMLQKCKKKIIFSHEAHFDLGGYVNKQNCRIWDTENPHAYIEKPTHSKQVTVWSGNLQSRLKPYFSHYLCCIY